MYSMLRRGKGEGKGERGRGKGRVYFHVFRSRAP